MSKRRKQKWWEEYRCGCVSEDFKTKRDLVGYCPTHGESRRGIFHQFIDLTLDLSPRIEHSRVNVKNKETHLTDAARGNGEK